MALNAKQKRIMALNAKLKKVALNAKRKAIALDVEMKMRLWTPNGKNSPEHQTEKNSFECRTKRKMALNTEIGDANRNIKLRSDDDGSERRYWEVITMTLNVERRCDDGSER